MSDTRDASLPRGEITPWIGFGVVIVLALLMLCFNMLADGLRDAFDPKMKEM